MTTRIRFDEPAPAETRLERQVRLLRDVRARLRAVLPVKSRDCADCSLYQNTTRRPVTNRR
jgi:hypothetical protein